MQIVKIVKSQTAHPFGDHRTVDQAIPGALSAEEADPFLMCDDYNFKSQGTAKHEDDFPIGWHPHKGFDILSYIKRGIGRHGDSLGHRETFQSPGMQWMSCGSGIEHAEGGGTPAGESHDGFQIWVNVPSDRKLDAPRYGTEPPESIPQLEISPGALVRVLAGEFNQSTHSRRGPFATGHAEVQMFDYELKPDAQASHHLPAGFDTCLLYVYEGSLHINGQHVESKRVIVLDATSQSARGFSVKAGQNGLSLLLFAGKKLKQPIAWYGSIVMTTDQELRDTYRDIQSGAFPPVRAPWDYKTAAAAQQRSDL